MEKVKRAYEKPELKGKIAFEASGAVCCKLTFAACSVAARDTQGKGNRRRDTS